MKARFFLSIILTLSCSMASAEEWTAVVDWSGKRILSAPVSAQVKKLHVRPGEIVSKGQSLVSLDCGQYAARYKQSKALVAGLAPAVERAKKDRELANELFERTVLSEVEYREAGLLYIEKKSRHDAAKAELEENEWLKNQCELKATRAAVVLDIHVTEGEMLNNQVQNSGLLTVANSSAINVVATVAMPINSHVKPGQKIKAEIAGKSYNGQIISVQFQNNEMARLTAIINHFDIRLIGVKNAKLISQ